MVNWWKFIVGLLGVVGIAGELSVGGGSWLVGLAFLGIFISSFVEK